MYLRCSYITSYVLKLPVLNAFVYYVINHIITSYLACLCAVNKLIVIFVEKRSFKFYVLVLARFFAFLMRAVLISQKPLFLMQNFQLLSSANLPLCCIKKILFKL